MAELRKNMSPGEVSLWQPLRNKQMQGFRFERQRPIDKYIVDFYCRDLKLAIEIDGTSHDVPAIAENDKVRQQKLETLGIHFLRFTELEVNTNLEGVLQMIETWIKERRIA